MKTIHYHIGRGGRFYNPGQKSFQGEKSISQLLNYHSTFISWENYDEICDKISDNEELLGILENCRCNSNFTEFEKMTGLSLGKEIIVDHNGTFIINSDEEVGVLNWDGLYDTDIIQYLDTCDENDLLLILDSDEFNKINLIQEFFDNTYLKIDWEKFNGLYHVLISEYFNNSDVELEQFYNED